MKFFLAALGIILFITGLRFTAMSVNDPSNLWLAVGAGAFTMTGLILFLDNRDASL